MSLPELLLWGQLRGRGLTDLRFRRQHPIGPYILDFYCASAALCLEVDGYSHDSAERIEHDRVRTLWLEARGIRVLRFPAAEVLENLEGVLTAIALAAAPSTGFAGPPPP
jgi:very-short-patch-repair endonuclease